MMKMKEQQRINMKAMMERERNERTNSDANISLMHPIIERSNESGSLVTSPVGNERIAASDSSSSLLMQSLGQLDSSNGSGSFKTTRQVYGAGEFSSLMSKQ